MSRPAAQRIGELRQLLRLQQSRVAAAEAGYHAAQAAWQKVKEALDQRLARIERLREQIESLNRSVETVGGGEIARYTPCAAARREWLAHDLERDEYWLEDDRRELAEAEEQLRQARRQWLQCRARETRMENLLQEARTTWSREMEDRLEAEAIESITQPRRFP